ncbi:MAG: ABC transporter ATP-binding protein [Eubacteriales bacterium]|nr:ABC transporter ATP-binding protein [Eubacteriales bacterium]
MIEVRHLAKKYGNHYAVQDLSFELEGGKIYGLLGPNGAGKSTTMNMITGYIASTEGDVLIDGHSILEEPEEAKKHIGYLPEIPPLYVDMTVREYLWTVAELKKIPRGECDGILSDIMDRLSLTEMKNRLIRNLSKGYRQRVGIAQALIGNPEIIILDEPTVGLDPKQLLEIRELVRELGKDHTVILSSHILSEVSEVCEYVLIMKKGRLIARERTENLGHLFRGHNTLEMEAEGEITAIRELLKTFSEAENLEVSETEEHPEICRIRLETPHDKDIRKELFFKFASAGIPILEMRKGTVSLEDIFLELTDGEQTEQKEAGEE